MNEVELYRQMLTKDPSSKVFVYLAEALFERSMYAEAIETCSNGLRLHPHDLRARLILGLSYLQTDNLDRAESELLRAKEILEINTSTYRGLAELYERRGEGEKSALYRRLYQTLQTPEAMPGIELEEAPQVEPEVEAPEAQVEVATLTMAELYAQQGHFDKAAAVYHRILETSPDTAGVPERLADLERKVKAAQLKTKLLFFLEKLRDHLKTRSITRAALPSQPGGAIHPERLAAFVRTVAQRKRAS